MYCSFFILRDICEQTVFVRGSALRSLIRGANFWVPPETVMLVIKWYDDQWYFDTCTTRNSYACYKMV